MSLNKLLEKIAHNWPVKALSVVTAIILFSFHRMSILEERFFSVPLQVRSEGYIVPAGPKPSVVKVTLRGDAATVHPILESDIQVFLDLAKYSSEGIFRIPVHIEKSGSALVAEGLEIRVEPSEIRMPLEYKASKLVDITPNIRGFPESGYELTSWLLNPSRVEISGPASRVAEIQEVYTDFVDMNGKRESFSVQLNILNPDTLVSLNMDQTVEYKAVIKQSILLRTFERLPVSVIGLAEGLSAKLESDVISIKVQGSRNEVSNWEPDAETCSIQCSDIESEGEYILTPRIIIPEGFTLVSISHPELKVIFKKELSE